MAQQTAVDLLMQNLFGKDFKIKVSDEQLDAYQLAAEKFEKQIIDAFNEGNPNEILLKDGEQYYNETFGGQGSPDTNTSPTE